MSHRLIKVNENIQRELSGILLEFPVVEQGLITITGVLVAPDLRQATVWMSILNHPNPEKAIRLLNERSSELYEPLSKRLRMKFTPQLTFKLDEQPENIDRIEAIIDTIHSGEL